MFTLSVYHFGIESGLLQSIITWPLSFIRARKYAFIPIMPFSRTLLFKVPQAGSVCGTSCGVSSGILGHERRSYHSVFPSFRVDVDIGCQRAC